MMDELHICLKCKKVFKGKWAPAGKNAGMCRCLDPEDAEVYPVTLGDREEFPYKKIVGSVNMLTFDMGINQSIPTSIRIRLALEKAGMVFEDSDKHSAIGNEEPKPVGIYEFYDDRDERYFVQYVPKGEKKDE